MSFLPAYLDNQATTPLDPRVRDAMRPYWETVFGNPHSTDHSHGWEARTAVTQARSQVAMLLGADDDEIVFTSGATESCNLAIRGLTFAPVGKRNRIVTLATEHPAVLETVQRLGQRGFDPVILPVGRDGILDIADLDKVLDERVLLVSIMAANNEIGVIQPLSKVASLCREVGAIFHSDATQAVGRMGVDVGEFGVDLLSMSGHKIYGPKGIGALFVRKDANLRLEPLFTGGRQERGLRAGTVAVPLVAGLGEACAIIGEEWGDDAKRIQRLTDRLRLGLQAAFPDMRIFGNLERRVPGNLSVGFPGVLAEEVIAGVVERIAISTGSACSSGTTEPSGVLLALGLEPQTAASGVRISFGRFNSETDVEKALAALTDAVGRCKGNVT